MATFLTGAIGQFEWLMRRTKQAKIDTFFAFSIAKDIYSKKEQIYQIKNYKKIN